MSRTAVPLVLAVLLATTGLAGCIQITNTTNPNASEPDFGPHGANSSTGENPPTARPRALVNGSWVASVGDVFELSVNETFYLDGKNSTDPEGEITKLEWELGDGTTHTGATLTHRYTDTGVYFINLTATDAEGNTGTGRMKARVTPAPTQAPTQDAADAIKPGQSLTQPFQYLPDPVGTNRYTGYDLFEPTIGTTTNGTLFTSYVNAYRSTDYGASWEEITGLTAPPTTFDPYTYVDEDTDRVYTLSMEGLNCNWIRYSDDEGESWTANPLGCGQPPVLDHPSLFAGEPRGSTQTTLYENVLYLCVNRLADSGCATSLDGGVTWSPFVPVYEQNGPCTGGLHGHGTTGPEGIAYLPTGTCGNPVVAISEDNGLTWDTVTITNQMEAGTHEVNVATDSAGNVYTFWVDPDHVPYLAYSTDHGQTWSNPIEMTPPGEKVASFPTIAAGSDGRVAMAFYATDAMKAIDEMENTDAWTGYLVLGLNTTQPDRTFAAAPVTAPENPIARGPCDEVNRCNDVGDFIDIVIDDAGRPWAVYTDSCMGSCNEPDGSPNDQQEGFVGTLTQGPALRGPLAPLDPLPT